MCDINQYLMLVESENCQISYCRCCKTFSLAYQSCCASFTGPELAQFFDVLAGLKDSDFHYELMGKEMAIVKNPMIHLGFCFTQKDVEILKEAITETRTLFEAFKIVYN